MRSMTDVAIFSDGAGAAGNGSTPLYLAASLVLKEGFQFDGIFVLSSQGAIRLESWNLRS